MEKTTNTNPSLKATDGAVMVNAVKSDQTTNVVEKLNGVTLNPRQVELEEKQAKRLMSHFHYHKPNEKQVPCYAAINEAARVFADTIMRNTPTGADQTAAVRKIVEAKMTANTAIATNPTLYQ